MAQLNAQEILSNYRDMASQLLLRSFSALSVILQKQIGQQAK